jgi:hypothetical protein
MSSVGEFVCLRGMVRLQSYNKPYKYFTIGIVVDGHVYHTLPIPVYLSSLEIYPPQQQWVMPVKHLYAPGMHAYVVGDNGNIIINNVEYTLNIPSVTFRKTGRYELVSIGVTPQKTIMMQSILMSEAQAMLVIEQKISHLLSSGDEIDGNLIWGRIVKIFVDARDEHDNKVTHMYGSIAVAATRDYNVSYLVEDPITLAMFFVPARYCMII